MAKKPTAAKRKKRQGAETQVNDFLTLTTKNKAIQARLKKARKFDPMALARGLGYKFTKAQLVAAMRKKWQTKPPFDIPATCTLIF